MSTPLAARRPGAVGVHVVQGGGGTRVMGPVPRGGPVYIPVVHVRPVNTLQNTAKHGKTMENTANHRVILG